MELSTMNQLVNVMVENAYTATEDDELSLRPGDIIRSVERCPGGWWRGELKGRVGLFPDNFVRIMGFAEDASNDVTLRNTSPRYCRALFSYQQANPDELSLAVGDIIQVLGEEEEGWWRGQRGAHRGVFPSNFVEPLETAHTAPPPVLPPKPVREHCQVLFPYTAANADELTLVEGDVVAIVSRDVPDQGWWRGELRGRIGLFPDNFVRLLPLPAVSGVAVSDTNTKKPGRPVKNLSAAHKSQPTSMNRKDSTSSKSSIGSAHENVASVRKSLEVTDNNVTDSTSPKTKKMEHPETGADGKGSKPRKSLEVEPNADTKSRKSLEVDGVNKPPVPSKKAGSPVAAIFSGFKQKMLAAEQRLTGQQQTLDVSDGVSSSRPISEPVLRSISPSPLAPVPHSSPPSAHHPVTATVTPPSTDTFDQIERSSLLNDPRAGRVKAPRRRPPSQVMRDDVPLTNGSVHQNTPEAPVDMEIIKPKAREWEKHRAPWMEELKLNQAKKTSPISEIGRSKTISTAESNATDRADVHHGRLSGSSDKILESGTTEDDKDALLNPLEMSQSMTALSSNAIKIETVEEVQSHTENPSDMSKSMSTMNSRATHLETNNKVSSSELRTSISSTASVILRSTTVPNQPSQLMGKNIPSDTTPQSHPSTTSLSTTSHTSSSTSQQSVRNVSNESSVSHQVHTNIPTHPTPVIRPASSLSHAEDVSQTCPTSKLATNTSSEQSQSTGAKIETGPVASLKSMSSIERETVHKILHSNGDMPDKTTPEQLLIAHLNERVANLERVVEAQEERFSAALSALNTRLLRETELRASLQSELHKLERCVTRV